LKLFWDWWKEFRADDDSNDDNSEPSQSAVVTSMPTGWHPSNELSHDSNQDLSSRLTLQHDVNSVCVNEVSKPECTDIEAIGNVGDKSGGLAHQGQRQLLQVSSSPCQLVIVCLLGSLDDIAVFSSMLLSGNPSVCQLALGVLLGSTVVVALCMVASLNSCVVRLMEKIPLWCIIAGFAAWTYFQYFVMD
jgi:hypothetical protein